MYVASFFEGLSASECSLVLSGLERRRFQAGSVVMVEGDRPRDMYVVEAGMADVFVADRMGVEHRVNRVGPGSTLGEMALFTGEPASATVRAVDNLELIVLGEDDFRRAATAVPRIYHNLGAILSQKLFRADRRTLDKGGEVISLRDRGAPPLLGYALACSVAWHTRKSTLLLVLAHDAPTHLAVFAGENRGRGAELSIAAPSGAYAPEVLAGTLQKLRQRYDRVLVQSPTSIPFAASQVVDLSTATEHTTSSAGLTVRGWGPGDSPSTNGVVDVPELAPSDYASLADGSLPAASPASRMLGRAARRLSHLTVGLALGGGGSKGYAHVGVLRRLERLGVPVDFLAGTSIGAAVAALHALGHSPDTIADTLDQVGSDLFRPALSIRGLLSDAGLNVHLRSFAAERRIEELPVPLAVVAADIAQGREVIFRKGLVWAAVFASISIPGVYPAKPMDGHILVDGGVVDPVPMDVTAEMGADVVLGVKLRSGPGLTRVQAEAIEPRGAGPSVLEAVTRSLEILQTSISPGGDNARSILIRPSFEDAPGWGLRQFSRGRRYIESGEAAVAEALPRLGATMPWVAEGE
jgi:NTE family protein